MIMRPSTTAVATLLLCGVATTAIAQDQRTYTYDALGRLIEQESDGPPNDNEVHSICYDAAGNRIQYRTSDDGSSAGCDPGAPGVAQASASTQSSTPTASQVGNNSPVTSQDNASGECDTLVFVNLTANDHDPEGHYPLQLTAISQSTGQATAIIASASSVTVEFAQQVGSSTYTYTVTDSQGASSTGSLNVTTSACGGGS